VKDKSMGGKSCCSCNKAYATFDFDVNFGKDWIGVYEIHHCHIEHDKNKYMTYHDKFIKECFGMMHLMTI